MSLKIALVGCGKIADGHIEEIQKIPHLAQVVAVCDREFLMAEQVAVRYNIPAHYDDFELLLEREKPDVVHITTPPQSHISLALQALNAGCHIYVEKPLTLNYTDSKRLIDEVIRTNRKLTIGYTYYFDQPAEDLRDLYRRGLLGDVLHVDSYFGYNLSGIFGTALLSDTSHWVHRLPGKLFHNNIDHLLYKATEFMLDETPMIHARASIQRLNRYGDARDAMNDELRLSIQGDKVSLNGIFSSHIRPIGHWARIYGTKNTVQVDYLSRTVIFDQCPAFPSAIGRVFPPFVYSKLYFKQGLRNIGFFRRADFQFFSGLQRLIVLFYESILNDEPPPISYFDILRISSMMDEIFLQIRGEENL